MENQESKSKWDDLARELGAEIRPDEPPQVPPVTPGPAGESYSGERSTDKLRPALPKRAAADWSQLNTELGLPPVEEPAPPPVPPRSTSSDYSLPAAGAERAREPRPRDDRPPSERPPRDLERGERGGHQHDRGRDRGERGRRNQGRQDLGGDDRHGGNDRSRGGRGGRDRAARGDDQALRDDDDRGQRRRRRGGRGRRGRDDERGPERSRDEGRVEQRESQRSFVEDDEPDERAVSTNFGDVEAPPPAAEATQRPAAETPTPPSAGISLWHKIFGSPAQQAAKLTDEVAKAEEVEIDESISVRESSYSAAESSREAQPPADVEADDLDAGYVTEPFGEPGEAESDESRRRRGRRRRGRGRGGRGGERRDGGERTSPRATHSPRQVTNLGGEDDFDDLGVEQDDEDVESQVLSDNGDPLDGGAPFDDSLDGLSSERNADGKGHRSIPSWEEAIGFIVDANMQSRPNRRPTTHSGPRGGSSRSGRVRGGRRRNRPSNGPAS